MQNTGSPLKSSENQTQKPASSSAIANSLVVSVSGFRYFLRGLPVMQNTENTKHMYVDLRTIPSQNRTVICKGCEEIIQ